MATDLVLIPDDQPGVLARMGEALGAVGVNVEGLSAFTGEGKGVVHLLVEDDHAEKAAQCLSDAGFSVRAARPVLLVEADDRPGALGHVCRRLADADVNIAQAYVASRSRLVLAVDDLHAARAALAG